MAAYIDTKTTPFIPAEDLTGTASGVKSDMIALATGALTYNDVQQLANTLESFAVELRSAATVAQPGDRCLLRPEGRVQHWDCDEFADGVTTYLGKAEQPVPTTMREAASQYRDIL